MKSESARWVWAAACLWACGCTALAGLDEPYHLAQGGGGSGGGGCEGGAGAECAVARCGDLPEGLPGGVYRLDPDGGGPEEELQVYCGEPVDGDRWALVFNTVGSEEGTTTAFWNIPYADRLGAKGDPSLGDNHYQGALYLAGREYRDEIEDLDGKVAELMRATADGISAENMHLLNPVFVAGNQRVFSWQFAAGWSSPDFDADEDDDLDVNCAVLYSNVTQHYGGCFVYSIGSDGDDDDDVPYEDGGFGPHIDTAIADTFGLKNDATGYTRVRRITRWTRW
ncbi:fibrinogen-like YCDxxxxGGGW domain-containing protein [Sorangium sp. So ce1000]|uniref:fibrinogen-like YCDxxxxGGGW domain-containing protein n=1 Tax=Sorangium sp. So ce1000 TaxID=3133325 RepID=UPI003F640AA1